MLAAHVVVELRHGTSPARGIACRTHWNVHRAWPRGDVEAAVGLVFADDSHGHAPVDL